MPKPTSPSSSNSKSMADWLEVLAQPTRITALGPIAARFAFSLRLIALHERSRRDPVAELAARLGSIEIAAKSLALGQVLSSVWPENIHVSRCCCQCLTHDEATIGALIEHLIARDRAGFDAQISGLVRPERVRLLWDAVLDLVTAEMRAV